MKAKYVLSLTILFCLFQVSAVFLSGEENVMTPEKIVAMKRLYDVQLSPDGKKIAYVLRVLDEEEHRFITDIYVACIETGESIQMTYHPKNDSSPRWSPDGRFIAFIRKGEGDATKPGLWLIRAEGGEAWPMARSRWRCDSDSAQ